jgi:hypothetical protein
MELKIYISIITAPRFSFSECARYDPELGYTQGRNCRFDSVEFKTVYNINSAGLRDDKASLDAPEIIVLGDSCNGISRAGPIEAALERNSGQGIERRCFFVWDSKMLLLNRLDTSNLKYLIIQYCITIFMKTMNTFQPKSP